NVYYTWPAGNSFSVSGSPLNEAGTVMRINSPLLNGRPGAVPIATYNQSPAGLPANVYTRTIGLGFNAPQWQVFNNSSAHFVLTQTYNILVQPSSFVVTATLFTQSGDSVVIDNPLTNHYLNAMVFATARSNGGTLNARNVAVWWDGSGWEIFNENKDDMPLGAVYDVFVTGFVNRLPLVQR